MQSILGVCRYGVAAPPLLFYITMAKRFTDTDKWKKPFIRGLDAPYKLLWFYILDDCDHAGIWIVDLEIASIRCGHTFNEKDVLKTFNGQVDVVRKSELWFIRDFIDFQYGTLNPENRAHKSVLDRLKKYKIKPLISPLQGAKDKDKDTDIDKEKRKEQFESFWNLYDNRKDKQKAKGIWMKLSEDDINLIRKTINRYLADTPDKKFRKYPSTYLNQKTWIDYVGSDGKVDESIPIMEPGMVYVGMSEAYEIVRGTNPVSLHEREAKSEGDEYVRKIMKMNPSYQNAGDGWKYRASK